MWSRAMMTYKIFLQTFLFSTLCLNTLTTPVTSAAVGIMDLTVNSDAIGRYEKFEVSFRLDREFQNPYDPDEVSVQATFHAPSGDDIRVYGFYDVPYFVSYTNGYLFFSRTQDAPTWRVRFAPKELGQYVGTIKVTTQSDTTLVDIPPFQVVGSTNPGFVRVSRSGQFFEFENGEWVYPLGQNIYPSWAQQSSYQGRTVSEHEMTMRTINENHGKAFRFLMIPHNACLRYVNFDNYQFDIWPGYSGVNGINQMSAEKIDQAVEFAGELGLYMNLSALHASTLTKEPKGWERFPYNAANGGPANEPIDFFTNANAKALYKQELRYIIARWGYSPNLFIVELLQELDLFLWYAENQGQMIEAVKSWSAEMNAYVRSIDPYGHLISTSGCSGRDDLDGYKPHNLVVNGMYMDAGFDVAQQHIYKHVGSDDPRYITDHNEAAEYIEALQDQLAKPWIIGEWGLSLDGTQDVQDTGGIGYHNILWTSMMRGVTTWQWLGLPRTNPNNLISFMAVRAFLEFEDFEKDFGQTGVRISRAEVGADDDQVYCIGLSNGQKALVWIQDVNSIELTSEPPARENVTLTIRGLADNYYEVEFWDTWGGYIRGTVETSSLSGLMTISLPGFIRDMALKVKHTDTPLPTHTPSFAPTDTPPPPPTSTPTPKLTSTPTLPPTTPTATSTLSAMDTPTPRLAPTAQIQIFLPFVSKISFSNPGDNDPPHEPPLRP